MRVTSTANTTRAATAWVASSSIPGRAGRGPLPRARHPAQQVAEENWFFRLSRYTDHLHNLIATGAAGLYHHSPQTLVSADGNAGRDWRPRGEPVATRTHDFPEDSRGKAIPYGVYCGSGHCGGCCTTRPPAPRKSSAWTCPTSTWATGGPGLTPKAATSGRCTSRPLRPGCWQSSPRAGMPGRCSSPSRAAAHRVTAAADLDPASGRARLSYEMAEQLFKRYSGGKTLHQLRHSRLTHLEGRPECQRPLLIAISGHKRLATLQRYVKPRQDAVAALMAASDPDRRSR